MSISDIWREHLRAIIDRIAPGEGRGVKRPAYREVAERVRSDEEYVYQVYKGFKRAGEEFATSLERAYGDGRAPGWINIPLTGDPRIVELPTDMAQPMSESDFKLTQRPMSWRELREMKMIPNAFEALLGDGAMAPEFPAGMRVEFEASSEPEIGGHVIVRDRRGELHFRLCRQAAGGGWEAYASGKGFRTLTEEEDGIRVVAIMIGYFVASRRPSGTSL